MNLPQPTYRVYGDLILCSYKPMDTGKIIVPDQFKDKMPPWVLVTALEVGEKCAFAKKGDLLLVNANAIFQNIRIPGLPQPYFTKEDKILAVVTLPEVPILDLPKMAQPWNQPDKTADEAISEAEDPQKRAEYERAAGAPVIPFPASSPEPAGVSDPAKE